MPRKPKYGVPGSVNMPGFPPNVTFSPQAAAQMAARQASPMPTYLPQGSFTVNGVNPYPNLAGQFQSPTTQPAQSPIAQQLQGLPQQNTGFPQGPLAGLTGLNGFQQQGPLGLGTQLPQPTQQNTQMPSQYLDPQRNQEREHGFWKNAASFFTAGAAYPNTGIGRRINDTLWGAPPTLESASQFTKFQQDILNLLAQGGLHGLTQTPTNFAPIGNQELERFYTQTVPSLAERFTAMGDGQRSSAFQGALGNAGRFLGNDLAAQQSQYNLQQQGNLLNMLNLGLTPQFQQFVQPGGTGLIPGAANAGVELGKAAIKSGVFA